LDVEHEENGSSDNYSCQAWIKAFSAEFAESMACRRFVMLRRGLLLWPLVRPTRAAARRALGPITESAAFPIR
jgi:hypothetical protein